MRTNYNILSKQLRDKVEAGEQVTSEDLTMAGEVARHTGRVDDRVLYAKIKQKVNEQK